LEFVLPVAEEFFNPSRCVHDHWIALTLDQLDGQDRGGVEHVA
jgi:hypothetical protein